MEFILSLLITWTVILVPPVLVRAFRRKALTKPWAIGVALVLFFLNHILFAVATGTESSRTFLAVGAFVSFYVLRWQTKASAADSVAAQRKSMGYDN